MTLPLKTISVRVKRENHIGTEGHLIDAESLEELREKLAIHGVQRVRLGCEIQGTKPDLETGWISPDSIDQPQFDLLTTSHLGMLYFLFTDEWGFAA